MTIEEIEARIAQLEAELTSLKAKRSELIAPTWTEEGLAGFERLLTKLARGE